MYNVNTCPSWEFQSAIKKQRSANHVICGRSALENTMQQNSYSRFPRQLITLSIMWSLYQSNVNWSLRKYKWALIEGERASDIFASNAVCSTSALERIRGSQINWKGLGSSWIEGCWGHIPDWERTPKSHLFWPHSARRLLLITLAARSN